MPQPAPKVSPQSSLARSGKAAGSARGEFSEVKTVATTKLSPLLCGSLLSPCCFCALALIRPDVVARCLVAVVRCAWSWFGCSCQNKTVLIGLVQLIRIPSVKLRELFVTQRAEVQITFFYFLEFVQTCHRIVSVIPSGSCYIYDYSNNHQITGNYQTILRSLHGVFLFLLISLFPCGETESNEWLKTTFI